MPSTVSASITMVANTGWLIETRVIHMTLAAGLLRLDLAVGLAAEVLAHHLRRTAVLELVELGGEHDVARLHAGEDLHERGARVAHARGHRPAIEPSAGDHPDVGIGTV